MGDAKSNPVRLSFNPQLRVEFLGATVTSDAGLLLPRELDERLGLSALIERHLTYPRTGRACSSGDSRPVAPDLARSVLRPAALREPFDREPLSADSPTHRAAHVAPDVITSPTG